MNPKEFEALATIDAAYWMLGEEQKKVEELKKLSPAEVMVDRITGHNPFLPIYKNIEIILKDMISAKRVLGDDANQDKKFLKEVIEYIKNNDK